jgi:hypothetical protein
VRESLEARVRSRELARGQKIRAGRPRERDHQEGGEATSGQWKIQ